MKRRIFLQTLFFIFLILSVTVYNYYHITKEEHQEKIDEKNFLQSKQIINRKKGYNPPVQYLRREEVLEMNPRTNRTYPENVQRIKDQEQRHGFLPSKNPQKEEDTEMYWQERGPDNISGRTRVVFFDPNDKSCKRVFAGGVSGGLWVNNDITHRNSLWSQIGIDENLSISCYAIDPNDSNIWYIGTGESFTENDGTGNGLWKSTNGGATWKNITPINFKLNFRKRFYFINKIIARNNKGVTEVYIATDFKNDYDLTSVETPGWYQLDINTNRIKRINWKISPQEDMTMFDLRFADVEIAKDNSIWVGTKSGKILKSEDGINFTKKYFFPKGKRVELTVSKKTENTIYAVCEIKEKPRSVSFVKTTDGTNFTQISRPHDLDNDIPERDFARGQAFYNLMLEVDSYNDNILYAGGINLFKSTDAGSSWTQISRWTNHPDSNLEKLKISLVHPDQHVMAFQPKNSNKAAFGNDGGVYYSKNLKLNHRTSIQSRNRNYNTVQFYSASTERFQNNEIFMGGTQDNGCLIKLNATKGINSYKIFGSGDGGHTFIDKKGTYFITSYVYNSFSIYLSNSSKEIQIVDDDSTGNFINIADLDNNLNILYTNGSQRNKKGRSARISRFTKLKKNPVRTNFKNKLLNSVPTVIKVSPYTKKSSTVFIGTESGKILKVFNFDSETPLWKNIDSNRNLNAGSISDISFGRNENEILITFHNYGINNIYYTDNGGYSWKIKDGNFPDIPTKTILMNPLNQNEVIVGTNFGVWITKNFLDYSPTWDRSKKIPSVKITKLQFRKSDNTILASTYGRGLFTGRFGIGEKFDSLNQNFITHPIVKNNIFKIESKNVNALVDLHIYNFIGVLVFYQSLDFRSEKIQNVDLSLPPGIYIVNIIFESKKHMSKIIVTH